MGTKLTKMELKTGDRFAIFDYDSNEGTTFVVECVGEDGVAVINALVGYDQVLSLNDKPLTELPYPAAPPAAG